MHFTPFQKKACVVIYATVYQEELRVTVRISAPAEVGFSWDGAQFGAFLRHTFLGSALNNLGVVGVLGYLGFMRPK